MLKIRYNIYQYIVCFILCEWLDCYVGFYEALWQFVTKASITKLIIYVSLYHFSNSKKTKQNQNQK